MNYDPKAEQEALAKLSVTALAQMRLTPAGHRTQIIPSVADLKRMSRLTARQRHLTPECQAQLREQLRRVRFAHAQIGGPPAWCMYHLKHMLTSLLTQHMPGGELRATPGILAMTHIMFAEMKAAEWGSPLWILDPDAADALLRTEPPFDLLTDEILENSLRLPFPGLYLQVPLGLFDIQDPNTGAHPVEGIWIGVGQDLTAAVHATAAAMIRQGTPQAAIVDFLSDAITGGKVGPEIVIAAVGKCKGIWNGALNDTVSSCALRAGMGVPGDGSPDNGIREAAIALNFLVALNTQHLDTEHVAARTAPNPKKRRMREKGGEVFEAYTHVYLRGGQKRSGGGSGRGGKSGHTLDHTVSVKGHWHSYWVTSEHLEGQPSLGTRMNDHGTQLHRVVRWVHPYIKGPEGAPDGPRYVVHS